MIELLIVWIYLAFICFSLGYTVSVICAKGLGIKFEGIVINFVLGFAVSTVIVEYMSLLINIGKVAVIVLAIVAVILDIICFLIEKKSELGLLRNMSQSRGHYIVLMISLCLFALYFSVMTLTTEGQGGDTYLYHAQAVRWLDDYGCVKGIANLNTRIGFNNASFAFYAIGTFNEIFDTRMHCTLGFLLLLFSVYLVEKTIIDVGKGKYTNILFYISCLFYAIKNAEVGSTYLTDYPANIMAAFILIEWIATFMDQDEKKTYKQAVISILCVFIATVKFSFGLLALLAVIPVLWLVKNKEIKKLVIFVVTGILVLLPFLIRNVIISGWLIYPFAGLDLFNVVWKVPRYLVENEIYWVYSWGRLPGDNTVLTMESGIFAWVPAWIEHLSVVQKGEVFLATLSSVSVVVCIIVNAIHKRKISLISSQYEFVLGIVVINLVYWFVSAPDVRFVSVLLSFVIFIWPMVWVEKKNVQLSLIAVIFVIAEMGCSTPIVQTAIYLDSVDNLKHLVSMHQIWQYDNSGAIEHNIEGHTVYEMRGITPAYHELPCVVGESRVENIYFLGDNISDGFAMREK